MRKGRGGRLILKAAPTSQPGPLCDQPIPVFSLRAALLPATLSQDPAYHACDCPSPLTGDRLHLWFSCPTPTSDRDRKTCQIPFSCPWGNQLSWSQESRLLPLPPSPISAASSFCLSSFSDLWGHTIPWESPTLGQVNNQEGKGSQTLPMWRKNTGHLESGSGETVCKAEVRAREKLLSGRWGRLPWPLESGSLVGSDCWGNGPGWGQTVLAQPKL